MALSSLLLAALVPFSPTVESPPTSAPPVIQDEEPTDGKWHGFVEAGGSYSDGNTDIRSARLAAEGVKRVDDDRFTLRGNINFTNTTGEETQNNGAVTAQWDHFVNEKLYLNATAGYQVDKIADVDQRWYVGGGVGYQFRDDEKLRLSGEAGLAFFSEEFSTGEDNEYLSARVAYDLDYVVSETTLFEQNVVAFPSLEDAEDFYGRASSKLSFLIKDNWTAYIQHIFNYDNTPASGSDRVDNQVIAGLRWNF